MWWLLSFLKTTESYPIRRIGAATFLFNLQLSLGQALFPFAGGRIRSEYWHGRFWTTPWQAPTAPPNFYGAGRLWIDGVLWSYHGVSTLSPSDCTCALTRFDGDAFGRSFLPQVHRYGVTVLDPNGNVMGTVGRYDNADSGRGAGAADRRAIGFCNIESVAVSDRALYVVDTGNGRIVRLRLEYAADWAAPVP